ncbi:hypothetical protein JKP88DRAFT_272402 [Tribonema minus]|uniref:Uncharacterized protein n=1 Tax=Tribonema minus TaxID=303371 RepID=A0A835ZLA6_9STRA|nr:hypothetical protein JKP88DRAFT_272402 [Tribonema minus]
MSKKNSLQRAKENHKALIEKEREDAAKRAAKKAAKAKKTLTKPKREKPKNAVRKAQTPEAGAPARRSAYRIKMRVRVVQEKLRKSVGVLVRGAPKPKTATAAAAAAAETAAMDTSVV